MAGLSINQSTQVYGQVTNAQGMCLGAEHTHSYTDTSHKTKNVATTNGKNIRVRLIRLKALSDLGCQCCPCLLLSSPAVGYCRRRNCCLFSKRTHSCTCIRGFLLKAWSTPEYDFACLARSQEYLPFELPPSRFTQRYSPSNPLQAYSDVFPSP